MKNIALNLKLSKRRTSWSLKTRVPHSLRAQFALALCAMGLLIVAGGATAVYALHATSGAARQLAEDRLARVHTAQDLLQQSQRIQWQAYRMVATDSDVLARQIYARMNKELDVLEHMTARLAASDDVSVLDLHQASQMFRNSAHLMAHLRESSVAADARDVSRLQTQEAAREEMRSQAQAMVMAARSQSDHVSSTYQAAVKDVVEASQRSAAFVVGWLAFSLVAAWLIARLFLGQHIIGRLQEVSRGLRCSDDGGDGPPFVRVNGNDEIGAMARAVERFVGDRRQLAMTRERLDEGRQRLAAIIDNTADGIVVLQAGSVVQVNPAAQRMFGLRHDQMIGMPGDALLPGFEWPTAGPAGVTRDAIAAVAGGALPVEVSISPVASNVGAMLVLVLRDATLRKQAERHLVAARDAAEAARATQAAFLANMSHELRTPLNAVLGYAQVLLLQRALNERQTFAVETIRTSGEHLLALINDLLDLAKNQAGKLELCPGEMRLVECLHATADIVKVKAEESGLEFSCEIDDNVPSVIVADEKRLRQVVLNLLSNAVKFTDSGRVMLRTRVVRADAFQARLRFEVRDTGVGMSEGQLEAIFQPFEQVGDLRRRASGSGLGLSISRQLVRLMGGDIHVSSTPGQGTTFWFELDSPVPQLAQSEAA